MTLASRLTPIIARVRKFAAQFRERWTSLSPRHQYLAMASFVAALLLIVVAGSGQQSCATHADVETRVADLTSQLQQATADGKLSLEELADRIKRINAAATVFVDKKDAAAHCEALERLRWTHQ